MKWYSIINLQKLEPMNITCRVLKLEIMMTFNWWTAVLTLKLEIMMTSNWWTAVLTLKLEIMMTSNWWTAVLTLKLEIMMTFNWWAAVCAIPNELCTAALTQNGNAFKPFVYCPCHYLTSQNLPVNMIEIFNIIQSEKLLLRRYALDQV